MFTAAGHQHWWPGDTPFEVCVGAILTQNTSWGNVERAIGNLKAARALTPRRLTALGRPRLARLIRSSGYFNVKADRLLSFTRTLVREYGGGLSRFLSGPTEEARARLLAIKGIGPETADSMLLYAGGQPSFVVDTYTRRIFTRHGWCRPDASYEELRALCTEALAHPGPRAAQLDYWQDYHAQLVRVGKHYCRPRNPGCGECPLRPLLPHLPGGRVPPLP